MSTVRAILRWPPVLPVALATLGFAAEVQPADLIRTDAEYPGVTYDASAAEKPWREAGEPDGAGELIPEKMVAEMERLFHEAIDAYEGRKSVLPECLQDATDRLLDDLRTADRTIRVEWDRRPAEPWTDATDGAPVEMADARPAPGEPKRYLKHAIIRLWGNVSSTHWVDPRNGCAQIAAQAMLHEVFHVATFAFPDCFKDEVLPEGVQPAERVQIQFQETITVLAPAGQSCNEKWTQDADTRVFPGGCPGIYPQDERCSAECEKICKEAPGCPDCERPAPGAPPADSGPGGDTPDDAVSLASVLPGGTGPGLTPALLGLTPLSAAEVTALARLRVPSPAVLRAGFWKSSYANVGAEGHAALVAQSPVEAGAVSRVPVVVIPSGGLAGTAQSAQFRAELESYAAAGGTLLVFAQQRGSDYSALPTPSGEPIRAWGWHEDNSCYSNAAYVETFHPILASQSNALVTSNIDGYFERIPEESTVLLRRTKNAAPSLFLYPYGAGWVIVTSSYDDWGGFNQSTPGSRAVIRDAVTWALEPAGLPIHSRGDSVSVAVPVRNVSDAVASQVRLRLLTPSRDDVLLETTQAATLSPGGATQITLSHGFAADAPLGIYHVDYELLSDEGSSIQPISEAAGGRIVIADPPSSSEYRPDDLLVSQVLPGGEDVVVGEEPVFRYRISNSGADPRRLRLWTDVSHRDLVFLGEVEIEPDGVLEGEYRQHVSRAGSLRSWLHVFEVGVPPRPRPWWLAATGEAAWLTSTGKGFRAVSPRASLSATLPSPFYLVGETATASVTVRNEIPFAWSGRLELGTLQTPVSLAPGETRTLELSFPVEARKTYYWVKLRADGVSSAAGGANLSVPLTRVQVEGQTDLPPWSLAHANPVSWTLTSQTPLPLPDGAVRAQLLGPQGEVAWEALTPLALAAHGAATAGFAVPAITPELHRVFRMTYETGHDSEPVGASFEQTVARRTRTQVSVVPPLVSAGEVGEVRVRISNGGNVLEEGDLGGEIEGIGPLGAVPLSLPPGTEATFSLPFSVDASVRGGLHAGALYLPNAPHRAFTVSVSPPKLELSLEDLAFTVGESVPVTVRNSGGSHTDAQVRVELGGQAMSEDVSLDAGEQRLVEIGPIPAHLPSGRYALRASAVDRRQHASAALTEELEVAGTAAALSVATDQETYAPAAPLAAAAQLRNTGSALEGLLHLEIATPCFVQGGPQFSYHVDTWDGSSWVERAERHLRPNYETTLVDLSEHLPDPDGEYKVQVRQTRARPAALDFVALSSGGALVGPSQALAEGQDVLSYVTTADDSGVEMDGPLLLGFPEAPSPRLVFRALEGEGACVTRTLWQQDHPLELEPAGIRDVAAALDAPGDPGQYVLRGSVLTLGGSELAVAEALFQVVEGQVAVSLRTAERVYEVGSEVTVTGEVRNLSDAAIPDLALSVYHKHDEFFRTRIHQETFDLAPGAGRTFETSLEAGSGGVNLRAEVDRDGFLAVSEWSFETARRALDVEAIVPDPPIRLVPTSPRLVAAEESDLDASTRLDDGALEGPLPFAVTVDGETYQSFRQSADGFVELFRFAPLGYSGECLDEFGSATVLAPFLGDLDPSVSGFAGYKQYAAGDADRAGRVFPTDTLVFFWDAPAQGDTRHNQLQLLLASDGLIRLDAGAVTLESVCGRTGLAARGETYASEAPAPFGLRLEQAVGHGTYEGSIRLENDGELVSDLQLDYGRVGGPRTRATVTLRPEESRVVRYRDAAVAPTAYSLVVSGDAEETLDWIVEPAGSLSVSYAGEAEHEPGAALLPVALSLQGGVGGSATVTYTLQDPEGSQTLTRHYDLEPGIVTPDAVPFELHEGSAVLQVAADVPLSAAPATLLVAPRKRITLQAALGAPAEGRLPIGVDVANAGLAGFTGEVRLGSSAVPVALAGGTSTHVELFADLATLAPGPASFTVTLASEAAELVGQQTLHYTVLDPRVRIVGSPAGETFEAAAFAPLVFTVRNEGDQPALGSLRLEVFDYQASRGFDLAPGDEAALHFDVLIDDDVEAKVYPARYVLSVSGAEDQAGQVSFSAKGIALEVEAALDREAYQAGDVAELVLEVSNGRPELQSDYVARVHYAEFVESRPFSVTGTTSLVFAIPITEVTGEPVFFQIGHPDGRSLYIDTLHLRGADDLVRVTLDAQVYEPGGLVTVTAVPAAAGALSLNGPGLAETLDVDGAVTRSFTLPAELVGGTYAVSWAFSSETGTAAGQVPFDVAGLRVRVFGADLDRGRYDSGETISSTLQIHTNQATSARLRAFAVDPHGVSTFLGEAGVSLDPQEDLLTTHSWPFASATAGLHRWVYGLYRDEVLLASGQVAFDVGSAVVLSVGTDRGEYTSPADPVEAFVTAYLTGEATLRLELGGNVVATRELSAHGLSMVPITLDSVPPGTHELQAVFETGAYESRRGTRFRYGTDLPDVVPAGISARAVTATSWELDLVVRNLGPTDAPATTLSVTEAGDPIGSIAVPAVAAGASVSVTMPWDVAGQAGDHTLVVEVDPAGAILEFDEENNFSQATVTVPGSFIQATTRASYPANAEASFGLFVTNLTSDTTLENLTATATLSTPDLQTIPLGGASFPAIGPGATASTAVAWAVAQAAPGVYLLDVAIDGAGGPGSSARVSFEVLSTPTLSGSVSATPNPAAEGEAVELAGRIENRGNVAADGSAEFRVVAPDSTIVLKRSEPVHVPVDGEAEVSSSVEALEVSPGSYDLTLRVEGGDEGHPVASTPFTVTGAAATAGLELDASPRVLVYIGGHVLDHAGRSRREAFVTGSLASAGALFCTTTRPGEFAALMRSGLYNTYVIFTRSPALLPLLADELREAAHRGDGLILVQWGKGATVDLDPALGARVHGVLRGHAHELSLVESPLGPPLTLSVPGRTARLELRGATVAGSMDGGEPGVTLHGFGLGSGLVFAFDPAVPVDHPQRAAFEALFASAVRVAAPKAGRQPGAGLVVPLAFAVENPRDSEVDVELALELPGAVSLASVDDQPVATDPPIWQLTLAPHSVRRLRFAVELPDLATSHTISSALRLDGVGVTDPPSAVLDVPAPVQERLAQAIVALEDTPVSGADHGRLRAALARLRGAQVLPPGLLHGDLRIRLAAEAAELLGRIQNADVSGPWLEVDWVIAAWERARPTACGVSVGGCSCGESQ